MPELPEVETIRVDLEGRVVGRTFARVDLRWPGCIATPSPEEFERALPGRRIARADRRGKFLILHLDGGGAHLGVGGALVVHLRMTGSLTLQPPGAVPHHHVRAVLALDDGHALHFQDQRKFGRLYLVPDESALAGVLRRVGPEPLAEAFDEAALRAKLRGRRTFLKPVLLDQSVLAGLGNIYVDEALFRARLHPLRRSDSLTDDEADRLYRGVVEALRQGIANRGTTLADYRDAWGTAGLNRERLLVFRRQGEPCPRCGRPIEKMRVAGRGTHFCPTCQPAPDH